ncbi:MAG: VOC family protein [Novosphingobium sp.]|nr:VOC family protein [Novosphingobium sp.]
MLLTSKPCQIAYFVPNVRYAAIEHNRKFGSGPFYVADNVSLPFCEYRGNQVEMKITSAFGQWGDLQVEFMQQNDAASSFLHDVFPYGSGRYGLHHLAFIVDDLWKTVEGFVSHGNEVALHAKMGNGIEGVLVDTIEENGHMLEFYEPTAPLLDLYEFISTQSRDFRGDDPVRVFPD